MIELMNQKPFGYGGRLVAETVWLRGPSGDRESLVTETVWLRRQSCDLGTALAETGAFVFRFWAPLSSIF